MIAFGYEPRYIEEEIGLAELEIRFLDALKLMCRQRQMQATTLLSAVGSLLVKKGQKTFVEEMTSSIEYINRLLGETEDALTARTREEIEAENQRAAAKAIQDYEHVLKMVNADKAGRVPIKPPKR